MKPRIACLLVLFLTIMGGNAQNKKQTISVTGKLMQGEVQFPLVGKRFAAPIYMDGAEAKVIRIATDFLIKDIETVTSKDRVLAEEVSQQTDIVIVGTIGKSSLINQLVEARKINIADIKGKWETFRIVLVKNPLPNIKKALCIIGSDDRGTAFGVLELSRMIGVHPFYWWADIEPEHKNELYINDGTAIQQSPSVQYRGIFLNDEDWGLQPWAAKKMDTAIKDIGPKTYEKIFELLLRLKANYIWPAMHPCTKAFYYYPENGKLAADYAIIVGTSHCEPMMRNNVFEWAENYKHEYGVAPKEWRYDLNKEQIYTYWNDRIKNVKDYPTVTTMGMRGIHDGSMPGPKDMPGKVNLLQDIIKDQRSILFNNYQKPVESIPQIFCPYKEVLNVYNAGLQLPDDISLVWSDDNHGYIRQLSNEAERKRSGGSGVYYHLSYWGRPQDYLWLSTISPSLIGYEMSKAYAFDAKKLWVFNVGDIKPAEAEMQYAMEIAWDINKANPEESYVFTELWAKEIFGKEFAPAIAFIKNKYYELAAAGKPEHLLKLSYRDAEADNRLQHYQSIAQQAIALYGMMPERLKDAYFQLVLYPVIGASLMNEKVLYAKKSIGLAQEGNSQALQYSAKSKSAFDSIVLLTSQYNQQIAKGKWDGMMSWHPRDLEVFKMPKVADEIMLKQFNGNQPPTKNSDTVFLTYLSAGNFDKKKDLPKKEITIFKGLGIDANGIGILPFATASTATKNIYQLPYAEYSIDLTKGNYLIQLNCLPTHDVNKEAKLSIAVAINNQSPVFFNIEAPADTAPWDKNVVQGFVRNQLPLELRQDGKTSIKAYFPSSGVVLNTINIVQIISRK
jgi:hypothetical protein